VFTRIRKLTRLHADRPQRFGAHGDHLRIGMEARRPHCVGIALPEFPEAAGARFLVAPDRPGRIAPERAAKVLAGFSDKAGERRCQVVTQGDPLLVIVLQGEHAFIRSVGIGQEFAKRVDILKGAGFEVLKAPLAIDAGNGFHQPCLCMQEALALVGKAARLAGKLLAGERLAVFVTHGSLLVLFAHRIVGAGPDWKATRQHQARPGGGLPRLVWFLGEHFSRGAAGPVRASSARHEW
jgi:hypothetical protein